VLRITADINVIISALNFSGIPARILDMAEAGEIRLAISDDILKEVERVLQRHNFGWTQEQVDRAIRGLSAFAEHVEPEQHIDLVKQDPTTTNPRVRSGQRVGISCERRQASVEGRAISRDKNCDAGRFHRGNSAAEPGTVAASRFELIGLTWTFI
jgi:hypothetical protein